MRICLVDDDSTQLEYFKTVIQNWSSQKNIDVKTDIYHSSEEMLFENPKSYPFDMIILDIQMYKMSGIDLAKKIRETDKSVIIAFVSGVSDYVFQGYEVQAIRYILKPIKPKKVYELLDLLEKKKSQVKKSMIISILGDRKKIDYDDIIYIESMGHYITFHLEDSEFDYKYNISNMLSELPSDYFVKTHRSFIVNLKFIEKITKDKCILSNDIEIPLSRSVYKNVNARFIEYYKGSDFK